MKLQNVVRFHLMVIGIAAVLLFPRVVSAQEIENSQWNDGPNVTGYSQPAAPATTSYTSDTTTEPLPLANGELTFASIATPQPFVTEWAPIQLWTLISLLVCISLAAVFAVIEAKRADRSFDFRLRTTNPRPTTL